MSLIKITGQSSEPVIASGNAGVVWYDTSSNSLKYSNGTSYQPMGGNIVGTGGTITSYTASGNNYIVHSFTTSGSFFSLFTSGIKIDVLMVGGGGGGGGSQNTFGGSGAGGGGGVYEITQSNVTTTQPMTIVVGAGGLHGIGYGSSDAPQSQSGNRYGGVGGSSSILLNGTTFTCLGGGGGSVYFRDGLDTGGSGGGASNTDGSYGDLNGNLGVYDLDADSSLPSGHETFGSNGGNALAYGSSNYSGAGGGGAGHAGYNVGSDTVGGNGGEGRVNNWRDGTDVIYGSGGGGAGEATTGKGGNNVTGNGAGNGSTDGHATSGLANQGGGGGGAGRGNVGGGNSAGVVNGGSGGSGIVVVRYKV
tara:strand:- start:4172 stop:5257 length:1086 start_codon:yes stop_codon:yes gene_type:complete